MSCCTSAMTAGSFASRSEEHTSELQSPCNLVCRLLLEKKKRTINASRRRISKTPRPTRARSAVVLRGRSRDRAGRHQRAPYPHLPRRVFFFVDTATTEIYTLSLHDALPI